MDDTGQKAELQQREIELKLTMEMKNDHSQTEKHQVNNQHDKLDGCSMDGIQLKMEELDGHEM